MFDSECPRELIHQFHDVPYGVVMPWQDPISMDDYWYIHLGKNGEMVLSGPAKEDPEGGEPQLRNLLKDHVPDCIVLMERKLFDRFKGVCDEVGIEIFHHEFAGELAANA